MPLTELAIQGRFQRGSPEEIRMSSDNERERVAAQWGSYCILLEGPILARTWCWARAVLVRGTSRWETLIDPSLTEIVSTGTPQRSQLILSW